MRAAPAVKICGLRRRGDAEHAVAAGAAYLGVILAPGRRSVSPAMAAELLRGLPAGRVGVFVDAPLSSLLSDAATAGLDVIQLHGSEEAEYICQVREGWGGAVWRAIRPRTGEELVAAAERLAGLVDALLVDGFSPLAPGGTGTRFPWREIAGVRGRLPAGLPLVVAGGLRPENVAEAVRLLDPAVVDVSSGVELEPGVKDPAAVTEFISRARGAPFPVRVEPT